MHRNTEVGMGDICKRDSYLFMRPFLASESTESLQFNYDDSD